MEKRLVCSFAGGHDRTALLPIDNADELIAFTWVVQAVACAARARASLNTLRREPHTQHCEASPDGGSLSNKYTTKSTCFRSMGAWQIVGLG